MAIDNLVKPGHAPYASSKAVLIVFKRLRDAGLPEPLTLEGLERVGVPSTMTGTVLKALRFLELVDEGGNRLPGFERLRRASSVDYQATLAEIIRESYINVFQIADPVRDSYEQLHDAFRGFDPENQRPKMVRLFLGLCEEAGIVSTQPQRHRISKKSPSGEEQRYSRQHRSRHSHHSHHCSPRATRSLTRLLHNCPVSAHGVNLDETGGWRP